MTSSLSLRTSTPVRLRDVLVGSATTLRAALLVSASLVAAACSDPVTNTNGGTGASACLNGVTADCRPIADIKAETANIGQVVTENSKLSGNLILDVGGVALKEKALRTVTLSNSGNVILPAGYKIRSVRMQYDAQNPEETDVKALECWDLNEEKPCDQLDGAWKTIAPKGYTIKPGSGLVSAESFVIRYTAFDNKVRTGVVTVELQGISAQVLSFKINISTKAGSPKANLLPPSVNYPYVKPKECATELVKMANTGDAVLNISQINLSGIDKSFQMRLVKPEDLDTEWHEGGAMWTLPAPLSIKPSNSADFEVKFCPADDKKKQGQIKFIGNDSSAPSLTVQANSSVPCIQVLPPTMNFGGAIPGSESPMDLTIKNCGSQELVVTDFVLTEDTQDANQEFFIDQTPLAATGKVKAPPPISAQNPLVLGINEFAAVTVKYAPADISKENTPDTGEITVVSSAYVQPKVKLSGIGVEQTCPIAKIKVAEGEEVVPQTNLHLNGSSSLAPGGGTIKKYKWTVKQPTGSNQPLLPSATFPNPTLQANTAGEYEFCLEVWDQNDVKSCVPACTTVLVIPNNAIHVELLWDTPSDPDQTDTGPAAGADLDLHFAHPLAAALDIDCDKSGDPWFSNPWDAFWFNPNPAWGAAPISDDPSLDLDDTDGAGPENLNIEESEGTLEDPVSYSVGVHYWNDHGYGTSYGTVSIYLQGGLALQFTKVKLDPLDMWYVGKLNWPNTMSGGPKKPFDTCYQTGAPLVADGGKCASGQSAMWQPKGEWCVTKCYEDKAFVQAVGGAAAASCKK